MLNVKIDRINGELQKLISLIIKDEIKDPRMDGAIVGVTRVQTTPDLKYAKVYVSIYAKDEESKTSCFNTINRSRKFIRERLKGKVNMRLIPELMFHIDDSIDYASKIDNILSKLDIPEE